MEEERASSEGVERDEKWISMRPDGNGGEGTGDEYLLRRTPRIRALGDTYQLPGLREGFRFPLLSHRSGRGLALRPLLLFSRLKRTLYSFY